MSYIPDFLPPFANLDGRLEVMYDRLYAIFTHDFKEVPPVHQGKPVCFDTRILSDGQGKEEGFWAALCGHGSKSDLLDIERAKRLPWCKPLIESLSRSEILFFDYFEGSSDKGIRRYIWLKDYDYVVILQQNKTLYALVTAYYVKEKGYRKTLQRKYENRLGK